MGGGKYVVVVVEVKIASKLVYVKGSMIKMNKEGDSFLDAPSIFSDA